MEWLQLLFTNLNVVSLFGIILLLGVMGGEVAEKLPYLPKISGYMLAGFLMGPGGFNLFNDYLLLDTRIFITISLGLVLFELGKHLDFSWLRNDRSLLYMSAMDAGLTFTSIFLLLVLFLELPLLTAALAAIIAIATSPAVVMMVAYDVAAEGPTTRRALMLTSLNNLIALVLFTLLLPATKVNATSMWLILMDTSQRLLGSLALAGGVLAMMQLMAKLIGKNKENQKVLVISSIVITIGFAATLHLSAMLSVFLLGVAARNFDPQHVCMELDFGWLTRLFFMLLFVVTGANVQIHGLWQATSIVIFFILLRSAAKLFSVWFFAKKSLLTKKQTLALGLSLMPMAGAAIGMSTRLMDFNPNFGRQLLTIIAAVIAILNIIGPIVTQYAFCMVKETNRQTHNA